MKHAFLIIAHNNFEILKRQLGILDHENSAFFIHIDKKACFDIKDLLVYVKYSQVVFIKPKSITWGGYSQVDCELRLLKEATKGKFDYYHLLSGVDMPLKSIDEIYSFFQANRGKEFIHFDGQLLDEIEVNRISLYHVFEENIGILRCINSMAIRVQKILKIDRLRALSTMFRKGANWFSITDELAIHILDNERIIKKIYRYSLCADEIFLQTFCYNSKFREKLFDKDYNNNYKACLRYIDWHRGKPYVFQKEDYNELIHSGFLFARKFDYSKSPEIVDMLFNLLKLNSN
jgi:hypothetical protein